MSSIFREFLKTSALLYIDDILVMPDNFENNLKDLEQIFTSCKQLNLKMNSSKCHFFRRSITFLGYQVTYLHWFTIDPKKLSAIAQMTSPKNIKELCESLGLFNFFRRLVCGYSKITSVFHDLLTKNDDYLWKDEHESAFQELKLRMSSGPILSFYDSSKPLLVISDSSLFSIRYVIVQEGQTNNSTSLLAVQEVFTHLQVRLPFIRL